MPLHAYKHAGFALWWSGKIKRHSAFELSIFHVHLYFIHTRHVFAIRPVPIHWHGANRASNHFQFFLWKLSFLVACEREARRPLEWTENGRFAPRPRKLSLTLPLNFRTSDFLMLTLPRQHYLTLAQAKHFSLMGRLLRNTALHQWLHCHCTVIITWSWTCSKQWRCYHNIL